MSFESDHPRFLLSSPRVVYMITLSYPLALFLFYPPSSPPLLSMGRYIGGLPNKNDRTNILKLLFDPSVGLGLSRVRYVIPASLNGWNSLPIVWWGEHDFNAYNFEPGVYNWTADFKQVWDLQNEIHLAELFVVCALQCNDAAPCVANSALQSNVVELIRFVDNFESLP